MLDQAIGWFSQPWKLWSVLAQLVFTLRFLVQWLRSEKAGRSVVPDAFWDVQHRRRRHAVALFRAQP